MRAMQTLALYHLKGGVGKTAAAVNLAYLAARDGYPTLFWDLDPQGAGSWYLEAEASEAIDADKLVKGKLAVGRLVRPTRFENLSLMPADFSLRYLDILLRKVQGNDALKRLLAPFREMFTLVVLDCPPSLSHLAANIFAAADAVAVPIVPSHLSLRAFDFVHEEYKAQGHKPRRLHPFFSMVDRRRRLHNELLVDAPKRLNRRLGTSIPYASVIERMGQERAPVGSFAPRHPASLAYEALWQELKQRLPEFSN